MITFHEISDRFFGEDDISYVSFENVETKPIKEELNKDKILETDVNIAKTLDTFKGKNLSDKFKQSAKNYVEEAKNLPNDIVSTTKKKLIKVKELFRLY